MTKAKDCSVVPQSDQDTRTDLEKLEQEMQATHAVIDQLLADAGKSVWTRKGRASLELARAGVRELVSMIVDELTLEDLREAARSRGNH